MLTLELLKKFWKPLMVALLALTLSLGGYYYGRQSVKPQTIVQIQEKIVEKEKVVTVEVEKKKEDKDITTVVTKKPDGSETTTTTEHDHSESQSNTKIVDNKEKETDKTITKTPVAVAQSHYRLGTFLETHPWELFSKPEKPSWGITASTRLVSSVWLDTSYNFKEKTATFGLSVEF